MEASKTSINGSERSSGINNTSQVWMIKEFEYGLNEDVRPLRLDTRKT